MGDQHSELAIVVVNFGSSALLQANLIPLAAALPGVVVVVVDNWTSEGERSTVLALADCQSWQTVVNDTNIGFGAGMNLGVTRAREAGSTAFLLMNPDLSISAESVRELQSVVTVEPLTLVTPVIHRPDGSVWFAGADLYFDDGRIRSARRRKEHPISRHTPWLSGACLMISSELWENVSGFSEDYFLYWEDVDLSYRVLGAGGALRVCESASAVHAEGGTQAIAAQRSGVPKSAVYYFFNIRNRLLFACRNMSTADLRRWRRATFHVSWEILLQGGRRQILRGWPLIAALRGMMSGLALVRHELRRRSHTIR